MVQYWRFPSFKHFNKRPQCNVIFIVLDSTAAELKEGSGNWIDGGGGMFETGTSWVMKCRDDSFQCCSGKEDSVPLLPICSRPCCEGCGWHGSFFLIPAMHKRRMTGSPTIDAPKKVSKRIINIIPFKGGHMKFHLHIITTFPVSTPPPMNLISLNMLYIYAPIRVHPLKEQPWFAYQYSFCGALQFAFIAITMEVSVFCSNKFVLLNNSKRTCICWPATKRHLHHPQPQSGLFPSVRNSCSVVGFSWWPNIDATLQS